MTRILVVDDEAPVLRSLEIGLTTSHYTVDLADDGRQALLEAVRNPPDLVILDLGLPQIDGHQVIRSLRARSQVPVMVLSGRTGADDKVTALDEGADDFLTKPFAMKELLARVRALLRRPAAVQQRSPVTVIGEWTLDLSACTVRRTGDGDAPAPHLTPTEWRLLKVLIHHSGELVTSQEILRQAWGPEHADNTNYLRAYFLARRQKREPDPAHPRHLLNHRGVGYRLQP
ncbi:response regulator [Streptomyces sp. NPDC021224]|uniref:response regulator n=1 Tax=unclassified Streptomyces TaxID=2593676 RepID=UPI00378C730B